MPVNVQSFTNDFTFQLINVNANGFTFTIQDIGPTALGLSGSDLGYGADFPGQSGGVARAWRLSSTSTMMPVKATWTMTLTDMTTAATFTTSWAINIPGTAGANTAYGGFTGVPVAVPQPNRF